MDERTVYMATRTRLVGGRSYVIESTIVNGIECDTGCWGEGPRGQYLPDRVAEICEELALPFEDDDDPRYWRKIAEIDEDAGRVTDCWEYHSEACDKLEQLLNDHTEGDYQWGFHDGEFFLWPNTVWQEETW
jgi:hypothetical protein